MQAGGGGFPDPARFGSKDQLAILFSCFGPIAAFFQEPTQEQPVLVVGEVLVNQRLQNLNRSPELLGSFLRFKHAGQDPAVFRISESFALMANRCGLPVRLKKCQSLVQSVDILALAGHVCQGEGTLGPSVRVWILAIGTRFQNRS